MSNFILRQKTEDSFQNRKLIRKLIGLMTFSPLPLKRGVKTDILGASEDDLRNDGFLKETVEHVISNTVPGLKLPPGWKFRAHFVGSTYGEHPQFAIETNLNWEKLNRLYHERVPASHSSLTSAYLITFVVSAIEATFVSSKHMAEIITDPVTSSIIKLKYL